MIWKRRWDPFIWQDGQDHHLLCLATRHGAENRGQIWWQDENVILHAVGPSFDDLTEREVITPPKGFIWTAPSRFRCRGRDYLLAGINYDAGRPNQRLWMAPLDDPTEEVGQLPTAGQEMGRPGSFAWRDASVMRIAEREWLLFVTTGGFRWGGAPNVILFQAEDPLGRWWSRGPVIDPTLAVLFAELERPQIQRIGDRWVAWWSVWPNRHFFRAKSTVRTHIAMSPFDEPLFSRPIAQLNGAFGLQMHAGAWCAGWEWTDIDQAEGDVRIWRDDALLGHIRKCMEAT